MWGRGTRATELPGVLWPGVEVPGAVGVISYAEEVWGVGACTEGVPEATAIGDSDADLWMQRETQYMKCIYL